MTKVALGICFALNLLVVSASYSQPIVIWDGQAGVDDFGIALNWNPNIVPNSSRRAYFFQNTPQLVTFSTNHVVADLLMESTNTTLLEVEFDLQGREIDIIDDLLVGNTVGSPRPAGFVVRNGLVDVVDRARFPFASGSTGELSVLAGGELESNFVTFGELSSSTGHGLVAQGGKLTVNQLLLVRALSNSSASLQVSDPGSCVQSNSVQVIGDGFPGASLIISNQAEFNCNGFQLFNSRGSVLVDNATLSTSSISESRSESFDVVGGGIATSLFDIRLGFAVGNSGPATISGAGSRLESGQLLVVGGQGSANLNVEDNAVVFAASDAILAESVGGEGILNLEGVDTRFEVADSLFVGGTSVVGGTASVNLNDGTISVVNGTKIWNTGTFNLSGGQFETRVLDLAALADPMQFNMSGGRLVLQSVNGALVQNGGALAMRQSPDLGSMDSAYTLAAGATLEMNIAGVDRGISHDAFDIAGSANLEGTILVSLTGGFVPAVGDSFDLIQAGALSGTPMVDLSQATLPIGLAWETSSFSTTGTISVVAGLILGDVNQDGLVNLLDIGPFVDRVSNGVYQEEADVNQDGLVNLLDIGPFVDLLSN